MRETPGRWMLGAWDRYDVGGGGQYSRASYLFWYQAYAIGGKRNVGEPDGISPRGSNYLIRIYMSSTGKR